MCMQRTNRQTHMTNILPFPQLVRWWVDLFEHQHQSHHPLSMQTLPWTFPQHTGHVSGLELELYWDWCMSIEGQDHTIFQQEVRTNVKLPWTVRKNEVTKYHSHVYTHSTHSSYKNSLLSLQLVTPLQESWLWSWCKLPIKIIEASP